MGEPEPGDSDQPPTRLLSIVISVAALAIVGVRLAWPDVKVDAVTLVLLAIAAVPWLGPIFKSIELPGGWKFEYQQFKREVQKELAEKGAQVETLANRIDEVEEFVITGATPDQERRLSAALNDFLEHLRSIGLPADPKVGVRVREGLQNSYYDPNITSIVIDPKLARDPDVVYREYSHYVLLEASPVPNFAALGAAGAVAESGVADYLVCSYTGKPALGEEAAKFFRGRAGFGESRRSIRDLANESRFSDFEPGTPPQTLGAVWGAFLWALRDRLGAEVVDRLVVRAWQRTTSFGDGHVSQAFAERVLAEAAALGREEAATARELLGKRGISLSD